MQKNVTTCKTRKLITNFLLSAPLYWDTNQNEDSNTCTGKQISDYQANYSAVYFSIYYAKETFSLHHSRFQDGGVGCSLPVLSKKMKWL